MSHYVKFTYQRARADIAPFNALAELNACRRKLLEQRLMGVDSNGLGFGNLSVRDGSTRNFYITGSATGGLPELTPTDCVRVVAYDFARNWLRYEGAAIPSSESLTHAAIYESDSSTSAVIHCHDSDLWATLLDRAATTSKSVAYGTPEMAYEIMRLFEGTDVRSRKILVMAGHEGGIVTFGKNLENAFDVLMRARELPLRCDAGRQYAGHSGQNARAPRQHAE
jgi:Class II Aldolase and Adducin N-terminal domain